MKYILDFDRTLFDTDAFVAATQRDGLTSTEYISPDIWHSYTVEDFLYPEVLQWLHTKNKADVRILTAITPKQGFEAAEYQKAKVEQEPIINLVKHIYYVESDKATMMQTIATTGDPDEQLIFVDDLLEHCIAVQAAVPNCTCFLMQRTNSSSAPPPPTSIRVIQSLADLDTITPSGPGDS
jgi:hypothetical protein